MSLRGITECKMTSVERTAVFGAYMDTCTAVTPGQLILELLTMR